MSFGAETGIKLSYFHVNIGLNSLPNVLLGTGQCSNGLSCLPGYQCSTANCSGSRYII